MPVQCAHPEFLWLSLVAVPMVWFGWRAMRNDDRLRRCTSLSLRALLLCALSIALSRPSIVREHDHLTVIGLIDVSDSVKRFADLPSRPGSESIAPIEYLRQWFRDAVDLRNDDDRVGLVVFDGQAIAIATPTRADYIDDNLDIAFLPGTNIEDAISLGLAMFPADTAKRLVLVSDGNETTGQAMRAARLAASGASIRGASSDEDVQVETLDASIVVPVDVLALDYEAPSDVRISRVESPPSAMPGQTITVRVTMDGHYPEPPASEAEYSTGTLYLLHENERIDLNGSEPGRGRRIAVPPGPSVELINVTLGETPVNRFEAIFEPDDSARDALLTNNSAEAFTATPAKGTILVLDPTVDGPGASNTLTQFFDEAELPSQALPPSRLPPDLLALQRFDLIILRNVAAYDLTPFQHEMLARFVTDLGGGLIMTGGDNSFGAGGWKETDVAEILPVDLDPPRELRLPTSALVLVLDKSGSMAMPVAGARATQQEVANEGAALAVESLRDDTIVGVVTFDFGARRHVEMQRNINPKEIADQIRAIQPDGGTNLRPALLAAHSMLNAIDVDQKRIVCLSDGQSEGADFETIARNIRDDGIKITTIAVGDEADQNLLERIAEIGEGQFYNVSNPATLPRVLVDSVQVVNKPLIKEGRFEPTVLATGSSLTDGMFDAPPLLGIVVTGPKSEPGVILDMTHPDGEPLLARWQAGLGRVAAFTSDVGSDWSARWSDWPEAQRFWTQLARTTARAPASRDAELNTWIEGGRMFIQLEAHSNDLEGVDATDPSTFLTVRGTVYSPNGQPRPIRLVQVSPTRFETDVEAREPGNYIVALAPKRGDRAMTPLIGGVSQTSDPEFDRYVSNTQLLRDIRDLTGGRTLDIAQPASVPLFDREGMPTSRSYLPSWEPILLLAILLLLLDIASRRIAWSSQTIVRLVNLALRRTAPASRKANEAAVTLASLRGVADATRSAVSPSAAADGGDGADGSDAPGRRVRFASVRKDAKPKPAPEVAESAKRPDEKAVSSALDQLFGAKKRSTPDADPSASQAPESPKPSESDAGDDDGAPTDTTSSLLEARRRARRERGN